MVSRLAPFQHAFVQRLSELGIAYPGSPIVEGPGERYLDDSMRGGKGVGRRFLVMIGEEEEPATREAAKQLCEEYRDIAELRRTGRLGIKLVRPDGYVALAEQSNDGATVLARLRLVLRGQTSQSGATAAGRNPT